MKKPFTTWILGVNVAVTNMQETVNLIIEHIRDIRGEFICLSNVHTTVVSVRNEEYCRIQNSAFLALPDGGPLSLVQRLRGFSSAERVAGPDLMSRLWKETEGTKLSHYFYGSSPETIKALEQKLRKDYPGLKIAGMESPPYRALTAEEDEEAVKRIIRSGADFVWVGLGAPKQEIWMAEHRGKLPALMLGVGAGFDFHAGMVKRAPAWMQNHYLEWLYRLVQDPKRLWMRYVQTNILFILLCFREMFGRKIQAEDRKRLLIYAHYYYPDVASTGQILTDLAEGLKDSFHTTVICTVPSYTGKIEQYYRKHKYYYESINGVDILRIRVPEFRKNFALSRIINIVSYFCSAVAATFRAGRQDYVFTISQPPILGGLLGVVGKYIKKARLIYNIQDFNPEQIQAVGFTHNKLILGMMLFLDKLSCQAADKVIVVGRDMDATLGKRFPGGLPHTHINNWINEKEIYPLDRQHPKVIGFKQRYGMENKRVLMYSGNIGLYYDLPNLFRIIEKFRQKEEVVFAFIGEGSTLEELEDYQENKSMKNVVFIPYQDKRDLLYSLNAADVHFVVNAKGIKGVSVPSKLYGVMAAGKPVLGILEEDSEARLIVEEAGCGLSVEPGEYEAIEALIREFIEMEPQRLDSLGKKGREFLSRNLTKEISIRKYEDEILNI